MTTDFWQKKKNKNQQNTKLRFLKIFSDIYEMNNIKNSVQVYIMDKEQDKISEYHNDKIK